jgi:hypothetical protein
MHEFPVNSPDTFPTVNPKGHEGTRGETCFDPSCYFVPFVVIIPGYDFCRRHAGGAPAPHLGIRCYILLVSQATRAYGP